MEAQTTAAVAAGAGTCSITWQGGSQEALEEGEDGNTEAHWSCSAEAASCPKMKQKKKQKQNNKTKTETRQIKKHQHAMPPPHPTSWSPNRRLTGLSQESGHRPV